MIKARVTWVRPGRWKVWEDHGKGKPSQLHSFHPTKEAALAAARAQNVINKREASALHDNCGLRRVTQ